MEHARSPELRVGDAEREDAAVRLRTAAAQGRLTVEELDERMHRALAAVTRADLEPLFADLGPLPAPRPGGASLGPPRGRALILAVMSGATRSGRWRVARRTTVVSVMGGSNLDLTSAELPDGTVSILVVTVMGGSRLRLPAEVPATVSKLAIMGGNDVKLGEEPVAPSGPQLRVRLISLMGGAKVRRARRRIEAGPAGPPAGP